MAPRATEVNLDSGSFNRDPFGRPALRSLLLHAAILASIVIYALVMAHIHGSAWGNRSDVQGSIQATMVSSAPAIPLPREQKPTDQVLATQTPSPAPAPPAPQTTPAQVQDSIPIPVEKPKKLKLAPEKKQEQPKPLKLQPKHIPVTAAPLHPEKIRPTNRAEFGEAAPAAVPRSMAQATPAKQVNVQGGNFGELYPWYVDLIKRRTAQNWYKQEVDPSTPQGARVYLTFVVNRSGAPSRVEVEKSSGSPTLDNSCVHAVQRVDSYGPLPGAYHGSTLLVQYYCEQSGH